MFQFVLEEFVTAWDRNRVIEARPNPKLEMGKLQSVRPASG